jgi:Domain of unknown function (DUF6916)
MLEDLTRESFAPHVGSEFRLPVDGGAPVALTLIEATSLGPGRAGGTGRAPFSVVFRGPRTPVLPQRIHRLEHDRLGALEMFIVPIGPDAHGLCYEAIFT